MRHTKYTQNEGGFVFTEEGYNPSAGFTGHVGRCPGMPAGVELHSDWYFRKTNFDVIAELPVTTVDWTITEQGVATQALSDDLFPPHLILTNAAADNDSTELQRTAADATGEIIDFTAPGRDVYFETMVRFRDANNDASTVEQLNWFVGYASTDTTVIDGATDFVGFLSQDLGDDANQDIDFVSADAGATDGLLVDGKLQATTWDSDITTSGISAADTAAGRVLRRNAKHLGPNDWIKLAFMVQPGVDIGTTNEGVAYCWINDEHAATVNLADQVPNQNLCTTIAFQNGVGVAKIMDVAYILEGVRYKTAAGVIVA